jgi:beta-galactosidase
MYGINNKGLFFYDRTPKDVSFYYQAALLAKPVLTIAREWHERAGDRRQPVWVYTNQAQVELFVNGRSAGSQLAKNRTARWQVELTAGENRIVARAGALEDATTILFEDQTFFAVNAGGEYDYIDRSHVYWQADRAYQPGSWGYVGGQARLTHQAIIGTEDDALYQASREGAERYQFDVPDGTYEVILRYAEGGFAVRRSFVVEATNGKGITIAGQMSVAAIMVRRMGR